MLALRDQENAVHGRQLAAASKPQNDNARLPFPKTPAAEQAQRSPTKLQVRDENVALAGKKTVAIKQDDGARSQVLATPKGPAARAPLGQKTTNAKAHLLKTPALQPNTRPRGLKPLMSASTRKQQAPKLELAPPKIDVLHDKAEEDLPDIEYMPPRSKDLEDPPEELLQPLDLSVLNDENFRLALRESYRQDFHERQEQGRIEREKLMQESDLALAEEKALVTFFCPHTPACPKQQCSEFAAHRRRVKDQWRKTLGLPPLSEKDGSKGASCQKQGIKSKERLASIPSHSRLKTPRTALEHRSGNSTSASLQPTTQSSSTLSRKFVPSSAPRALDMPASHASLGYAKGRAARAQLRVGDLDRLTAPTASSAAKARYKATASQAAGSGNRPRSISGSKPQAKERASVFEASDAASAPTGQIAHPLQELFNSPYISDDDDVAEPEDEGDSIDAYFREQALREFQLPMPK